jgi:acetyl esterase
MSSAEAELTPKMRALLARIARANRPPLQSLSPAAARAAYEAGAEVLDFPRVPLARVEDLRLPDGCAARLYAASAARLPVLLYLHGGGFTVGSLETHDALCRQIAARAPVAVLALDYRLAPEHRFPAAVDDTWHALQWLQAHATSLGLDGDRLAVGGDSAGGTLAAVAALMARDAGLPLALQVLITPGTTAHADTPSHHRFAEGFLIDRPLIEWFFAHYIDPSQRRDWRFAPLEADDVEGVAPAWFGLAECDPLVDEGLAYADRLRMAGVAVDLELYAGVTHDFLKLGRAIPEAERCHAALAAALAAAFS